MTEKVKLCWQKNKEQIKQLICREMRARGRRGGEEGRGEDERGEGKGRGLEQR